MGFFGLPPFIPYLRIIIIRTKRVGDATTTAKAVVAAPKDSLSMFPSAVLVRARTIFRVVGVLVAGAN